MINVVNGDFLSVSDSIESLYFYDVGEKYYDVFGKKLNCNYSLLKRKGKSKQYRYANDNNESVITHFNIFKSTDFNFIDFNYETSEVIEIRLLDALQPLSCSTKLIFEVKFIDLNDNVYYKREDIGIKSFNGTQEKRLNYYKEFFDKYCQEYVKNIYLKSFKIPEFEILRTAYKELLSSDETIKNHCDHLNKEVAVRIFGILNNFSLFRNDRYLHLFSVENSQRYLKYLDNIFLNSHYRDQIFKIYKALKLNNKLIYLYKNTSHKADEMEIFTDHLNDFIKTNEKEFQ